MSVEFVIFWPYDFLYRPLIFLRSSSNNLTSKNAVQLQKHYIENASRCIYLVFFKSIEDVK